MIIPDAWVLIPARMGSVELPFKNRKFLQGKPLIQYTLELALQVFAKRHIIVNTDDPEIQALADRLEVGNILNRPPHLSGPDVPMMEVVRHSVSQMSPPPPEYLLLLQPTSPFRLPEDILNSYRLLKPDVQAVVSVRKAKDYHGYNTFLKGDNGALLIPELTAIQRQTLHNAYTLNGAIYWMRIADTLHLSSILQAKSILPYEMPALRSLDIDTTEDWNLAEILACSGYLPKL
jgi:CMP-N,N'-diacetyllegionaminic acid synthase